MSLADQVCKRTRHGVVVLQSTRPVSRSQIIHPCAWHRKVLLPSFGVAQIKFGTGRLARGPSRKISLCQCRPRGAGDGGLLETPTRLRAPSAKSSSLRPRFFSDKFAQTTAEVFRGNRFKVVLTPETPRRRRPFPYAVKHLHAIGGVMITASHNPPSFNGLKLKSHYGGSSDS